MKSAVDPASTEASGTTSHAPATDRKKWVLAEGVGAPRRHTIRRLTPIAGTRGGGRNFPIFPPSGHSELHRKQEN